MVVLHFTCHIHDLRELIANIPNSSLVKAWSINGSWPPAWSQIIRSAAVVSGREAEPALHMS